MSKATLVTMPKTTQAVLLREPAIYLNRCSSRCYLAVCRYFLKTALFLIQSAKDRVAVDVPMMSQLCMICRSRPHRRLFANGHTVFELGML